MYFIFAGALVQPSGEWARQ